MKSVFRHHIFVGGAVAVVAVSLFAGSLWAAKNFTMPTPQPAKTYPAKDAHPDEGVTVALDPYDKPEKTAPVFSVKYAEVGYLPIFMVITNDGDEAVSLNGMKAQLVTADKTKLAPADEDDLYRRLSHPNQKSRTYPLPFPTSKGVKGAVGKPALDEIQNAHFAAKAVEPHSSQAGFLFFEISDVAQPLAGAQFYLTGVRDSKGNELMYFEVPLEKYLNAAKP